MPVKIYNYQHGYDQYQNNSEFSKIRNENVYIAPHDQTQIRDGGIVNQRP